MNDFAGLLTADIRLVILRLLAEASGYRANESVLAMLLDRWGHLVPRDRVRTELAWLAEQGAVSVEEIEGIMIATLTPRGQDASRGAAVIPGVRRPLPTAR